MMSCTDTRCSAPVYTCPKQDGGVVNLGEHDLLTNLVGGQQAHEVEIEVVVHGRVGARRQRHRAVLIRHDCIETLPPSPPVPPMLKPITPPAMLEGGQCGIPGASG